MTAPGRPGRLARRRESRRRRRRLAGLIATVLVVGLAAAGAVSWSLRHGHATPEAAGVTRGRGGVPTDNVTGQSPGAAFSEPATAATVMLAARAGVQAVDSYDYRSLGRDRATGLAATTGVFRANYDSSMRGAVGQSALRAHTVQSCVVQRTGLVTLDRATRQAVVLVFAVLTVTDSANPTAQRSPVSLDATMQLVGGSWLIAAMSEAGSLVASDAPVPGTPDLRAAVSAARSEVGNLVNYRRAQFDSDFQRALDGLGPTAAEQQQQNRASIHTQMINGGYDLVGSVGEVAVEDAGFDAVTLLVAGPRFRQDDTGNRTALPDLRAEVAMARAGSRWLLVQLTWVGVD